MARDRKIVNIVVSILTDSRATILETSGERIDVKWAGMRFGNKLRKRTARLLDIDRFQKQDDCLISGRAMKASFGVYPPLVATPGILDP